MRRERTVEEKVQDYLNLLKELKSKGEIKRIVTIIKSYGLHSVVSVCLYEMGIIDRFGHVCYFIERGELNEKLAFKVHEYVYEKMRERREKSILKLNPNKKPPKKRFDYPKPQEYKNRFEFAKAHGFGDHSPISKMIFDLGKGNYTYGYRLFERKFKEFTNN